MLNHTTSARDDCLGEPRAAGALAVARPVELMLNAASLVQGLAGVGWQGRELTVNYRISGSDTFAWGDQSRRVAFNGIAGFIYLVACPPQAPSVDALAVKYGSLLGAVEAQTLRGAPTLQAYMRQVEAWARAYDQEAETRSPEELDALYDDAFVRAMDPDNPLP